MSDGQGSALKASFDSGPPHGPAGSGPAGSGRAGSGPAGSGSAGSGPDWDRLTALPLAEFRPHARMARDRTEVRRAAYPVIDIHNHLGMWLCDGDAWMAEDVAALLATMDAANVATVVNLDGRWGEELEANLDRYDRAHPARFVTFAQMDWTLLNGDSGGSALITQLEDSHRRGARGLKVWKDLGLSVRDAAGVRVMPDDPRVIAVVRRAGALGMPVLIHTADPVAFFDPVDERNERLEELAANPHWWFGDRARFPTFWELMDALARLVEAAPGTSVIGAHVGCCAEDLGWVGGLMDRCPNFYADLGGRLAELGRQPRAFARFVADHPDQVVFGTDAFPPSAEALRAWFRFLETEDEHWPYLGEGCVDEIPPQGRWTVSGAGLSPGLLAKVYRGNAARLLGLP